VKRLLIPLVILLTVAIILTGCSTASTTTSSPPTTASTSTTPVNPPTSSTTHPTSTTPSTSTTTPASSKYGGTLRVIETSAPGAPLGTEWEGNSPPVYNTQQWAEERLMKEKLDGTMQPELATSWDITATGDDPNVVLHLRQGVKFSDGTDWNAQALAWNLQMFQDGHMFGSTTNYWKSWEVIDNYTLKLHFTQYLNTLTRAWENYFMVSPTAYETNGVEWMRTHMVGTGPFTQTNFTRDVSTTLIKNQNYWQAGRPYLDGVQLLYVADQLTRDALMLSGGGDMLNISSPQELSQFPSSNFTIISRPSSPTMLAPDSKNPDSPWSNLKVREAVDYAIDKVGMAKALGFGYGAPAYQLATSSSAAFDPALESQYRVYDVAKAKQLLADAGYPNGFKTTIIKQPGVVTNDTAVYVQAAMAAIGIQATIQTPEPAVFQGIYTGPLPTDSVLLVAFNEWSNWNTSMNVFFPRTGLGFYMPSLDKGPGWDDLTLKSVTAPAPDPVLLKQVEDALFNNCTVIPLTYSSNLFVTTNKLMDTGLTKYGTFNAWDYANTWIAK
jgi:peptide/nickel transport system substrate-binding protein